MENEKISGQARLIEALKVKPYTLEQLAVISGLKRATVRLQIKYHLWKKGVEVIKEEKDGKVYFKGEEMEAKE